MVIALNKLKKLKACSFDEWRVRSRQALAVCAEKYAWSERTRLPSDEDLFERLDLSRRVSGCRDALCAHFRERRSPSFFDSFRDPAATIAVLRRRFPQAEPAVIARAREISQGRFNLLGFRDLSFGNPVDWHLEAVSGKRVPLSHWSRIDYLDPRTAGDKKIIWELNRHQYFTTLGRAYWYTRDEQYARSFVSLLESWMASNPPAIGINWASSLEVAFRAISWLWALNFFKDSNELTPVVLVRILKFLYLHALHLETYLSTYFSPNTHLTGEALGLCYLGTLLPEFKAASGWRALGRQIMDAQLERHVRPDGVYFEQSSYYHRYTTDFYIHFYLLARANDQEIGPGHGRKLEDLLEHLMWITRPDGRSTLFGDDDGGRVASLDERDVSDFRATLATGAALFGRADFRFVAAEPTEETLWLLGPEALNAYDQLKAISPASCSRAFCDGGYFVMRDGWTSQSSYLLVDCGPHGALSCGHSHADALSFEFAAQGNCWLVDPGTFTYTADIKARDEFRSTQAHNTATVDGEPQSSPGGPFRWLNVAGAVPREFIAEKSFDYFEGEHDGYVRLADPVTHTRAVLLVKSQGSLPPFVVVRDQFAAHERHSYALRYHFADGLFARVETGGVCAIAPNDGRFAIHVYGPTGLRSGLVDGWVSRCYGERKPAPVAVFEAEATGPQEFVSFLLPYSGDHRPRIFDHGHPGASGFGVVTDDVLDVVLVGDCDRKLGGETLRAAGALAWARFVNGRLDGGCIIHGRIFEASGVRIESPRALRHCSIACHEEQIEISITGTDRFDLSLPAAVSHAVINGESIPINPRRRSRAFVRRSAGWELTCISQQA